MCHVGERCSFTVAVREPARWAVSPFSSFRSDLVVTLEGPARASAEVEGVKEGEAARREGWMDVSYRVWDEGEYR